MKSNLLWEKVLCIGALNLYEFALIGVLLVLVMWKGVKDDAVSLVIISALFFVAGGIIVDTIANDSAGFSTFIGGVVFVLSGIKLFSLRNYAGLKLKALMLSGLGIVLAWNYLISSWMAEVHQSESATPVSIWRYGWIIMLAGIALMILQAVLEKRADIPGIESGAGSEGSNDFLKQAEDPLKEMREQIRHQNEIDEVVLKPAIPKKPFLNSNGMVWIFIAEILIASAVHQYALSYIFDIKISFGDFIPLISMLCFLLVEIIWNYRKEGKADLCLTFVPLAAIIVAKLTTSLPGITDPGGIVWNPAFLSLAICAWVVLLAVRKQDRKFIYPASAYLITVILFGFTLIQGPLSFAAAHWHLPAILAILLAFIAGIIYRIPALSLLAVIAGSVGLVSLQRMELLLARYHISQTGAGLMLIGSGILCLYILLRDNIHISVPITGALLCAFGILNLSITQPTPSRLVVCAIIAIASAFCLWMSTRNKSIAVILILPLLFHLYRAFSDMQGWHFILLSFLLLIAGGAISMLKKGDDEPVSAGNQS